MDDLIRLINDLSTPVKLGWLGVLVWGVVQALWYQRGRVLPDEADAASEGWTISKLLSSFRRSSESDNGPMDRRSPLSIAREMDLVKDAEPAIEQDQDLGSAAELALEHLLTSATRGDDSSDPFSGPRKVVRHRKRNGGNPAPSRAAGLSMESPEPT